MILVSHYLYLKGKHIGLPQDKVVLRVNVAWIKNKKALLKLLSKLNHDIYLDYPQGRTKPPRPTITLDSAIEIAHRFPKIKYFAVSNVEDPVAIGEIKSKLPDRVEVVPKIETALGVQNLKQIVKKLGTGHVMLDKEDLYVDVGKNSKRFEKLVELARKKTAQTGATLLELHGVVFLPHKNK